MLQWIFGPVRRNIVHLMSFDRVAGYLELEKARVRYFLSINPDCLPDNAVQERRELSGQSVLTETSLNSARDLPNFTP